MNDPKTSESPYFSFMMNLRIKSGQLLVHSLSILITVLLLISCGSQQGKKQGEWEQITEKNTIEAYSNYLEQNPEGKHISEARQNIVELLVDKAKAGKPVEAYDQYIQIFPEGKNKTVFEKYIYEYAVESKSPETFEAYQQRFPEGQYTDEIQQALAETEDESDDSLNNFLSQFPENNKSEIDKILYDSAMKMNSIELYDKYVKFFPDGDYSDKVNSILDSIFYEKALESKARSDYYNYLSRYPRSDRVHGVDLSIGPEGTEIRVLDSRDSLYRKVESPATVYAIEGTEIKIDVTVPDFKPIKITYEVTEEDDQAIERELEVLTKVITIDNFEGSSTPWSYSGEQNSASLISGGLLECISKTNQHQKTREFEFDLNKDFQMIMRFRFESTQQLPGRPYFGILWGKPNQYKYYFISRDGHYNFGTQSQGETSPQNPSGYTQWGNYSAGRDGWNKAMNFKNDGFNEIKIVREGRQIKYFINGKYLHFENDISRYNSSFAGFGIGNAKVHLDLIRIEQFYD